MRLANTRARDSHLLAETREGFGERRMRREYGPAR